MDNSNRDSAANWPTQQLWPPAPGPGGNGGQIPNPPGGNDSGPDSGDPGPAGRGPRRISHATRWGVGVAVAAILVGGGAIALTSAGHPASPSGQAATLNTVLSSADSPSVADITATSPNGTSSNGVAPSGARPGAARCARVAKRLRAASHPRVARRAGAVCRRRLARVRLLVRGIHGQFTYQTKKGAKTLAFERGTIQAVTGTAVTVAASDGTTWTWHLVGNTVVRTGGKKVDRSALAAGQRVFAGGPVVGGADDARLIVIRPAASAGGPASSAPSSPAPAS